uniref:APC family permease n=1 Tax=Rubrobacter aplysinae TaxID=909625 RepID=UPI00064C2CFB
GSQGGEEEFSGGLRRVVSLPLLLAFVVGNIVGGGIYAAPGEVAGVVGGGIWLPFLIAFIVAILTAFSYAELVSKYPGAGGAALFVNRAYGIPLLSFVIAFAVMCSGLSSASGLSVAFGGDYLSALTGGTFEGVGNVLIAVAFLLILAVINYLGIRGSATINAVLVIISVAGLVIIVLIGLLAILTGQVNFGGPFTFQTSGDEALGFALFSGAVLAFYAFIGFEDSANIAEETRNPSQVYPRALFGGLLTAAGLYLVVVIVTALVVPIGILSGSSAALLEVVEAGPLPVPPGLFSVAALVGITNTALINLIIASRVIYGMGREGVLQSAFGRVDQSRGTPIVAILFTTALALALVLFSGDFVDLAGTTTLLLLAVFAVVNATVLVLRRNRVRHSHFRAPSAIPILGSIAALVLLSQQDGGDFLRAGILIAIGLALYALNLFLKRRSGEGDPQRPQPTQSRVR